MMITLLISCSFDVNLLGKFYSRIILGSNLELAIVPKRKLNSYVCVLAYFKSAQDLNRAP